MKIFLEKTIDQILFAVRDAVEMFDDATEIGTSDVSCCVDEVIITLGYKPSDISDSERQAIRNAVSSAL